MDKIKKWTREAKMMKYFFDKQNLVRKIGSPINRKYIECTSATSSRYYPHLANH